MRDIIITLLVVCGLPFAFKRPFYGAVMWIWISVMNPHTQSWGWAQSMPFAAIIAGTTLLAMMTKPRDIAFPNTGLTWTLLAFTGWMCLSTVFAIGPEDPLPLLNKVVKIMGMTVVVAMLVRTRKDIEMLVWIIVISLGFYGVKGGLFTIRSAGAYRVWGPAGTFIEGNNEIALALIMVVPLMLYLVPLLASKWSKRAMWASAGLCALAALGSYSRGAALALAAMLGFLWLKSQDKLKVGVLLVVMAPLALVFMPEQWHNRIDTINTYEQDSSAMGRINAWKMAINLAADHPLFGGGFQIYNREIFARYAPIPEDIHAAHSIYFQVLGEHGYVGLLLFLLMYLIVWRNGAWVIKHAAKVPELEWALRLVRMLQVSLIGFLVGGAFLSLAYFDVPYYIMVTMVATRLLVQKTLKERAAQPPAALETEAEHVA
ncbi:putative O-glycosylation ligase, exosortase A system-associated [Pseudoduganella violaceinigra]|uniref:putative O-glycosylation ligase, exosortase A system-associated n=1 Tax=Pseudoduganella violaceinigra TaxID=246602 RepID=UPI00041F9D5F|nr:putative O-glycosylation ligase, exosortase A system-associated [Pseudoduganella violaceinigra]